MRKLKIDRHNFELAFELSDYDVTAYLDSVTGEVVFIESEVESQLETLLSTEETLEVALAVIETQTMLPADERIRLRQTACIEFDFAGRYLMLPRQDSREGYRDMQEFIWTLEDEHLRELLETAIEGKGAFRRFKNALYRHPDIEARWFAFRDDCEHRRMLEWLASHDIEPEFE